MRFRRKDNIKKSIIVLSDLHLGAGPIVNNRRNFLEDFHHDEELVELLEYYSSAIYAEREVELIINGDFFDLLAVPFVRYFDDEYWSEQAAMDKLKIVLEAHREVMDALVNFLARENKTFVYILGNHDGELAFETLREHFKSYFPCDVRNQVKILFQSDGEYLPTPGVVLKHGHEYETANYFDPITSIITASDGKKYFLPPWGSYFVTRVINKFKEERSYMNSVRPIRRFIINGLIYDTMFMLRFLLSACYYFIMVRFIYFFKQKHKIREFIRHLKEELQIFQDDESLTEDFFKERPEAKALIVGHTHIPAYKANSDGTIFVNTGTWTKMHYLDFAQRNDGVLLTYAQIDVVDKNAEVAESSWKNLDVALNVWRGTRHLPFSEF